jgi:tetratricopeptide (TPR) repeat protein
MSVHAFSRSASLSPSGDAARALLHAHLEARSFAPCVAAVPLLVLPPALATEGDLNSLAALAIAETFGLLDAERAHEVRACVTRALSGAANDALANAGAATVLAWCTAMGEWCERHGLDHEFSRLQPLASIADADPASTPWERAHWRVAAAWHHEAFGRHGEVAVLLQQAASMATASGALGLQVVVWLHQARLALARSAPGTAVELAQRAALHADELNSPLWLADVTDVLARAALAQGDMHRAVHQARRAVALAERAEATASYVMTYRLYESYALLGLGAYDEAVSLAEDLANIPLPPFLTERLRLLARLYALVRDDRGDRWSEHSLAELEAVTRRLRKLQWPGVLALLPEFVARLWARALEAGIEADWVRASIRTRGLVPPEPSWPTGWPWSVRLSVLGPGSCVVGGLDLAASASGKAAAKPMALLRRLAVEGGHDWVAADALALALWPGVGREGRNKALETTLARLRRMLGHANAVLVSERRLRLNPQRVWLDSAALCRQLDQLQRRGRGELAGIDRVRGWDAVFRLWRGPLLSDEPDAPWIEARRVQLRRRLAAALHADVSTSGDTERRLRAIAADPLLERVL